MDRAAHVKVAGVGNLITVPITSDEKPSIPESYEKKWQDITTLAAKIVNVPAGLIMRLRESDIEVYVRSKTDGNPYEQSARERLGLGLYCETVVGKGQPLIVPDALQDVQWRENPDVALEMISYLGVPIRWPDGEVFGTFCVLDNHENRYTEDQRELLQRLAELIESDLKTLISASEVAHQAELRHREIRHRIKNQFNLLVSYIDLQSAQVGESQDPELLSRKIKARIQTLSKMHEHLSLLAEGTQMPLLDYLNEVAVAMVSAGTRTIDVQVEGDDVELDETALVPLGSLLNELVTNSLKYAFHTEPEPKIRISVRRQGERISIIYADNGPGLVAKESDHEELGRRIIEAFVQQLNGSFEEQNDSGYTFRIEFPLESFPFHSSAS